MLILSLNYLINSNYADSLIKLSYKFKLMLILLLNYLINSYYADSLIKLSYKFSLNYLVNST